MPKAQFLDLIETLSPQNSFDLLQNDKSSILIDVRTKAEWSYVGGTDLGVIGKAPVFLEWQTFPAMAVAGDFTAALTSQLVAAGATPETPLLFLCRSGVRSLAAARAMAAAGFRRCINIAEGFEGPLDDKKHRGGREGWKARELPWSQS